MHRYYISRGLVSLFIFIELKSNIISDSLALFYPIFLFYWLYCAPSILKILIILISLYLILLSMILISIVIRCWINFKTHLYTNILIQFSSIIFTNYYMLAVEYVYAIIISHKHITHVILHYMSNMYKHKDYDKKWASFQQLVKM